MKVSNILKNMLLGAFLLGTFCAHAQGWQQYFNEGKRLYSNGEYQAAYESFERAQGLAPDASLLDSYMAQAAYRAGLFEEAANAYEKANRKKPDTWSHYNEGNAHFKNNNFAKAIESYKEALRKDPTNDVARYNLTQAIEKLKEQQEQQNKQNQNKQNQPKDPQDKLDDDNQNPDKPDEQNQENQPEDGQVQPKLGREQTEQLLESMNQADKKAQDKLKDKKKKASSVGKPENDW